MLRRGKSNHSSQTLKKFDEFLKKRSQKKNILQSKQQSIDKKINCIEELFKLTKTGTIINPNQPLEIPLPEQPKKSNSTKHFSPKNQQQFGDFQENTDAIFEKLDKMVNDVNGWQVNKKNQGRLRKNRKKTQKLSKTVHQDQFKKQDTVESKVEPGAATISLNQYINTEPSPDDVLYLPMRKKMANNLLKQSQLKKDRHYTKNSTPVLTINSKGKDFCDLRKQISDLQMKAKVSYGLDFKSVKPKDTEEEESQPDHFQEMKFDQFKEFKRVSVDNYQSLVNQHTKEDSSIPASLFAMIRVGSTKGRRNGDHTLCGSRYLRV